MSDDSATWDLLMAERDIDRALKAYCRVSTVVMPNCFDPSTTTTPSTTTAAPSSAVRMPTWNG
ncbi:hypothetical protein [Nocardia sp. AB354]|uniref:hypothetical protein n=1 Tax=Nocardia sp. AB354 TaxID=3413283 RepID=UPI003C20E778